MPRPTCASTITITALAFLGILTRQVSVVTQGSKAKDPGVRTGVAAGGPIANLTSYESAYFDAGREDFNEAEDAADGLGPRMNLDSCQGCHAYPASGGSSPALNPQVEFARQSPKDVLPSFITANGPVREVRFIRNPDNSADGGVHALFTLSGRSGAGGCSLNQPDFAGAAKAGNVSLRIPTPVFGAGLIESIPDATIVAQQTANVQAKAAAGIHGHANFRAERITGESNANPNDGTVSRFGWKAQNKSLLLFAGEAYNVEMGITNELFLTERDEAAGCQFASFPNSVMNLNAQTPVESMSSIEKFAFFMRFLAPPAPVATSPSIESGKAVFTSVGCSLCHTPTLQTGNTTVAALRNQPVNLYSDLLVHDMGNGLADGVTQGDAGPREFRTAPLWGLGQRIFFLHDGRTSDLMEAISAHSSGGSEASTVVKSFQDLSETKKQDLLNFLRSL